MTNLIQEHFCQLLQRKRKERYWSRIMAAAMTSLSDRQYSNLENGKSLPEMQTLINLSIVYEIDLNQFIMDLVDDGYCSEKKMK